VGETRIDGIYQTGGSISVGGSLAVGPHAQAISVVTEARKSLEQRDLTEVSEKLGALLAALNEHADALVDRDAAFGSATEVAQELQREGPDKSRVASILATIREGAGSVAGVATAATALEQAVAAFL
jgi:hypothetical protein